MRLPGADCLTFTPAASLHMTLFQRIIDTRRKHPYWPADIPLHLGIDDMTRRMMSRLDGLEGCGPFTIRATEVTPTGINGRRRHRGGPADDAGLARQARQTLGYRHPDHEAYSFHITFAYVIRGIPDPLAAQWQRVLEESMDLLQREALRRSHSGSRLSASSGT